MGSFIENDLIWRKSVPAGSTTGNVKKAVNITETDWLIGNTREPAYKINYFEKGGENSMESTLSPAPLMDHNLIRYGEAMYNTLNFFPKEIILQQKHYEPESFHCDTGISFKDDINDEKLISTKESVVPERKSKPIDQLALAVNSTIDNKPTGSESFQDTKGISGSHLQKQIHPFPLITFTNVKVDTKVRPFKCHICSKRFTNKSHLTRHQHIHTGVKPFSCEVCQKTFNRAENVKIHMRVHSGERPYKCEICDKRFQQTSNLYLHVRTHSGVKDFQCHVCSNKFTQKFSLKRHLQMMHKLASEKEN